MNRRKMMTGLAAMPLATTVPIIPLTDPGLERYQFFTKRGGKWFRHVGFIYSNRGVVSFQTKPLSYPVDGEPSWLDRRCLDIDSASTPEFVEHVRCGVEFIWF
jgi:hypothetical protein